MLALFLHYGANAVMSLNSKPMQFMHFFVSFRIFFFLVYAYHTDHDLHPIKSDLQRWD